MTTACPGCGDANQCGLAAGKSTCWCFTYPASGLKWDPDATCLCTACLQAVIDRRHGAPSPMEQPAATELVSGE